MRIISKFKDYYDSAAVYGIDKERIFLRHARSETIKVKRDSYWEKGDINFGKYFVIGFCGEIFPFISVANEFDSVLDRKSKILFGEEAIALKENKNYCSLNKREPIWVKDNTKNGGWNWENKNHPQKIYDGLVNNTHLKEVFYKFNTPIFYTHGEISRSNELKIKCNAQLELFTFARVKDPTTAFSQLEQFISNNLVKDTEVDVPVGGNSIIARSKGFDQNSFKRDPTDKKYGKKSRKNKI